MSKQGPREDEIRKVFGKSSAVIFRYAPLEWFGKSTFGTCIWSSVKTDVVLVDLDPSEL